MKHLYKLDNAAKLFVSIKNKKNIPIFRVSVVLKEEVKPQKLQEALDIAIKTISHSCTYDKKGIILELF